VFDGKYKQFVYVVNCPVFLSLTGKNCGRWQSSVWKTCSAQIRSCTAH